MCMTFYYTTQNFKATLRVFVGVFDLVNHRKALPVPLPLDLKDVCGFPLLHQSSKATRGRREVIFSNAGVCALSFLIKLSFYS